MVSSKDLADLKATIASITDYNNRNRGLNGQQQQQQNNGSISLLAPPGSNNNMSRKRKPGTGDNGSDNDSDPEHVDLEEEDLEEEEFEEEEHFQAETYADYMPMKLKIGVKHPDPVVETASLSSVHPPNVWYRLSISEEVIDSGRLSALQLEAITYACQQHSQFLADGSRAGFLLGDGAGVGKGRTLAGIIHENYLNGRKRAIWLSVSNDLRFDAERDLRDIGAGKIPVLPLNKFKYGKISSRENGGFKKGVVFATYSSLIGESHTSTNKYRTRLKQLLHWCSGGSSNDDEASFDGVIVFDECHKAKNLCPTSSSSRPTKTGLTVMQLQKRLPKARIVYASATGASEPKNMAYMTRLGLWGPGTAFPDFSDFVSTVEKRGVGAMELVAIDMKLRGVYIARQLSFSGVQFRVEEIKLSKRFTSLYDECVLLWVTAKERVDRALELLEDDAHIKKAVWGQFWAAHQRFFKYLCIASKVRSVVNLARDALKGDKCVVIGLQSTGEAKTLEALEDQGGELNDFVSTAKSVFQSLIEKHFPAPNRKKTLALLSATTTTTTSIDSSSKSSSLFSDVFNSSLDPVDQIMKKYSTSESNSSSNNNSSKNGNANGKSSVWSMWSDSEDEKDASTAADRDFDDGVFSSSSSSDSDSDGFVSVSEGEDDNIDNMWDSFVNGNKKKKRKIKKKSKKKKKQSKPNQVVKRKAKVESVSGQIKFDALLATQAEFMSDEALDLCEKMRDSLLQQIEELSPRLPPNTLDELIDELGGPEAVAEMTGRKGRVTMKENGEVSYEVRTDNDVALELLNVTEKHRFMSGEKLIAIISEAASSGISLHSDKRVKNRKRRVHITIELPWSADRAIQQFGRTHRSNQASAPEYVFLISDLAGEQRFASIVAKRLESLGALTHGDRRATSGSRDLSRFNIDNRYGRKALEIVMKSIIGQEKPLVPPPASPFANFFKSTRTAFLGVGLVNKNPDDGSYALEKDFNSISKFLNRLLGVEVELQNAIFKFFTDTLEAVVRDAKRMGTYDEGIIDLTSDSAARIERKSHQVFYHKHSTGAAKIELHEISVERGMNWEDAKRLASSSTKQQTEGFSCEGFYMTGSSMTIKEEAADDEEKSEEVTEKKKKKSKKEDTGRTGAVFLAVADSSVKTFSRQVFRIYRPNTGLQSKTETASSLMQKCGSKSDPADENEAKSSDKNKNKYWRKVTPEEAQTVWEKIFEDSDKKCSHEIRTGKCSRKKPSTSKMNQLLGSGSSSAPSAASAAATAVCDVGLRSVSHLCSYAHHVSNKLTLLSVDIEHITSCQDPSSRCGSRLRRLYLHNWHPSCRWRDSRPQMDSESLVRSVLLTRL